MTSQLHALVELSVCVGGGQQDKASNQQFRLHSCTEFRFRSWTDSGADFFIGSSSTKMGMKQMFIFWMSTPSVTVVTMDYYIACCIFANILQCRDHYFVFEEQVALYKALDVQTENATWARTFWTALTTWEAKIPVEQADLKWTHGCIKNRRAGSSGLQNLTIQDVFYLL